jgi:hypothetical protein
MNMTTGVIQRVSTPLRLARDALPVRWYPVQRCSAIGSTDIDESKAPSNRNHKMSTAENQQRHTVVIRVFAQDGNQKQS